LDEFEEFEESEELDESDKDGEELDVDADELGLLETDDCFCVDLVDAFD